MPIYRTPLNDFFLDQIAFVEDKLNEAIRDAASQLGATASGVVPQLRERIFSEDQGKATQCVRACPELFDRDAARQAFPGALIASDI